MKIEFELQDYRSEKPDGYPLVLKISHSKKRIQKTICYCKLNQFSNENKMVNSRHPDYDFLAPMMMELKIKAKKIKLSGLTDVNQVMEELFRLEKTDTDFIQFAADLMAEMSELAAVYDKQGNISARNKLLGNVKVYANVMKRFKEMHRSCMISQMDYNLLMRFRNYHLGIGNQRATVHLYLRTLRAIYNKCLLKYAIPDKKPFVGVFNGLKVKSYHNKKKYITKEAVQLLEGYFVAGETQKYIDLWLLQFYFGGCDLIDLYYLPKTHIRKNRIYFERSKTDTGLLIDLAIHDKAAARIEKFLQNNDSLFLVVGRKDVKGYEGYRRRYTKAICEAQKQLGIEVMPMGGNLGVKVARHAFANIAKNLLIDPDLIRELMGHERDSVDNYYKDKFPEMIRDEALFKIVG